MATKGSREGWRLSDSGMCLFKGRGRATLTVLGYRNWHDFLQYSGRDLTSEEVDAVEAASSYENFSVEGVVKVDWPEVSFEFRMDRFLGTKKKRAIVFTATQDFATLLHPFVPYRTWYKGYDSHETKRINGYDWTFQQSQEDFNYYGHVKKGKETFVTFQFSPNTIYHQREDS